jgi:hypothetical protein
VKVDAVFGVEGMRFKVFMSNDMFAMMKNCKVVCNCGEFSALGGHG